MLTRAVVTDDSAIVALDRVAARAPDAEERGVTKIAELLGQKVAFNVRERVGGGDSIAEAFLTPVEEAPGITVLGIGAPFYALFLDRGAHIKAKKSPYLTFSVGGGWASVSEVTLEPRHFVSDAVDEFMASDEMMLIVGTEIAEEFRA
jgi:hypothetical protein